MSIVALIVILVLIGVALYLLNTVVQIDGKIKTIINVVVIVLVLLWLVDLFFGLGSLGSVHHIGHLR